MNIIRDTPCVVLSIFHYLLQFVQQLYEIQDITSSLFWGEGAETGDFIYDQRHKSRKWRRQHLNPGIQPPESILSFSICNIISHKINVRLLYFMATRFKDLMNSNIINLSYFIGLGCISNHIFFHYQLT